MTATRDDVTGTGTAPPPPPEAVPVRHPGRWVAVAVIVVLVAMFVNMLVTNPVFAWGYMVENMFRPPVLVGVRTVLVMTVLAMVIGVALGTVVAVMRLSPNPVLAGVAWVWTWFFRAIPRIVLLTVLGGAGILYDQFSFGLPFGDRIGSALGLSTGFQVYAIDGNTLFSAFAAGLLGLALSESAYMAEIVRGGLAAVDPGQQEAASALGMSRSLTLRRITLPQAMRVIIPPTGNEVTAMLKDTSLLAAVPLTYELFYQLQAIGNRTFNLFPLLVAACLWYLAMSSVLMVAQHLLERRFSRDVRAGSGTANTAVENTTTEVRP